MQYPHYPQNSYQQQPRYLEEQPLSKKLQARKPNVVTAFKAWLKRFLIRLFTLLFFFTSGMITEFSTQYLTKTVNAKATTVKAKGK